MESQRLEGRVNVPWRLAAAAFVVSAVLAGAWPELTRPGYSPDEEFTVFAVRGISASGLPLLPSGLLYDRGLAYSYSSWMAGMSGGDSLAPARALGLFSALLALVALWAGARTGAGDLAAAIAVLLVATSIPFWVVATSARFYAPFLALYLGALAVLTGVHAQPVGFVVAPVTVGLLVAFAAACRLTHELALTLVVVPLCSAALAPRDSRAKWIAAALAIVAGLVVAQVGIFALHFLAPESDGTMIRRFFLWQVLNLFERPPLAAPVGVVLVVGLAALLVTGPGTVTRETDANSATWQESPQNPRSRFLAPLQLAALMVLAVILTWAAVTSFDRALDYPLDLFWHLARTMPLFVVTTLALLVVRACGLGGAWTPDERAIHVLWLGWVVFFGVIESGITANYLLAPLTLMLAAMAVDLAAVANHQRKRHLARVLVPVGGFVLVAAVVLAQWGRHPHAQLVRARPTIVVPDPITLQRAAEEAQMVACTDELACLLLVGRVDRWLALDDFLRERFVVSRESGAVGVYAGAPAVFRLSDLFRPTHEDKPPPRVLVIDVFKDLPIGSSSTLLPRALASEGVLATSLIETPQLRVLELDGVTPRLARALRTPLSSGRPSGPPD